MSKKRRRAFRHPAVGPCIAQAYCWLACLLAAPPFWQPGYQSVYCHRKPDALLRPGCARFHPLHTAGVLASVGVVKRSSVKRSNGLLSRTGVLGIVLAGRRQPHSRPGTRRVIPTVRSKRLRERENDHWLSNS